MFATNKFLLLQLFLFCFVFSFCTKENNTNTLLSSSTKLLTSYELEGASIQQMDENDYIIIGSTQDVTIALNYNVNTGEIAEYTGSNMGRNFMFYDNEYYFSYINKVVKLNADFNVLWDILLPDSISSTGNIISYKDEKLFMAGTIERSHNDITHHVAALFSLSKEGNIQLIKEFPELNSFFNDGEFKEFYGYHLNMSADNNSLLLLLLKNAVYITDTFRSYVLLNTDYSGNINWQTSLPYGTIEIFPKNDFNIFVYTKGSRLTPYDPQMPTTYRLLNEYGSTLFYEEIWQEINGPYEPATEYGVKIIEETNHMTNLFWLIDHYELYYINDNCQVFQKYSLGNLFKEGEILNFFSTPNEYLFIVKSSIGTNITSILKSDLEAFNK